MRALPGNVLYRGDNLEVLPRHIPDAFADLIYLDPPFNSNATYNILFGRAGGVEAGTVEVQLQGACSSCAISSSTLQGGVERILKSRLDWVTEVIGGVDESADPFESVAMGSGGYVPKW